MYKPSDCGFGLVDDYSEEREECLTAVLLSVQDPNSPYWIDVDEHEIDGFPDFLRGRADAECFYAGPPGWSVEKTKNELIRLGFTHKPKWDNEWGS
jgi:hypothetical protein